MTRWIESIAAAAPLVALPTLLAESSVRTGVTGVGPATVLFTLAFALLLALVFRKAAAHVARLLVVRAGEWRVRRLLAAKSPDVLHGVLLPGAYGGLARIDHLVMTSGGLLCIRTPHCHGAVFGDADEPQWTAVDGVSRRRFLNPVIQNEGRRRALLRIAADVPVQNLVIFTGRVEFASARQADVIHVSEFESYLAKFVFGPSRVDDWDAAWLSVRSAALTDPASERDYAAQLGFA